MKNLVFFVTGATGSLLLAVLCLRPAPVNLQKNSPLYSPIVSDSSTRSFPNKLPASPEEGLRQLQASSSAGERSRQLHRFLPLLVENDAMAAARFAENVPDPGLREEALRIVALEWASKNPAAAAAWARQLPPNMDRDLILEAVCLGQASQSPESAVRLADNLHLADDLLGNLTQQWAQKDPHRAIAWVRQQPASPLRDDLIRRAAVVQATTDPMTAARLILDQIPPGPVQTEAIISVVHCWAQSDPARTAVWVKRFPAGIIQTRAWNEISGMAAAQSSASSQMAAGI